MGNYNGLRVETTNRTCNWVVVETLSYVYENKYLLVTSH